jgi:outer membrane beta-barrel protein
MEDSKKMKKTVLALSFACFLVLLASPARAQIESGQAEVFGFAGVFVPGNVDFTSEFADQFTEATLDLDNAVIFGGGVGYNLSSKWGIEGQFAYVPGNEKFTFSDEEGAVSGENDWNTYIYGGNLLYYVNPESSANLFVTAGAGGITLKEDVEDGFDKSYFQFNFGAGIKAKVAGSLYIRADVKDYVYKFDHSEEGFQIVDKWMHNIAVTGGIGFRF